MLTKSPYPSGLLLLGISLALTAAQCTKGVRLDSAMGAVDANDNTAFIDGCGNQPIVGYTYCRISEGDASNLSISLKVPPSECASKDACVFYTIFFPNGEPSLGGSIHKGQTSQEIKWETLIKKPKFEIGDRGFWGVRVEIHYFDLDGNERISTVDGEIRLRVLKKDYLPLHNSKDDPNFVWIWNEGDHTYRMTTGGRAYTGKTQ